MSQLPAYELESLLSGLTNEYNESFETSDMHFQAALYYNNFPYQPTCNVPFEDHLKGTSIFSQSGVQSFPDITCSKYNSFCDD